ncbi:DNA topoisomerase 2-binding protein 1-like [Mytilus trossulus]|uniref:DNA topoisomerase 2-binding protein 1-like n=1 Tax=Mytilus trossulus TaxID=6551 RepID=UPI0030067184
MSEGDFKMFCIRTDGSSGKNGATKAMFDAYANLEKEGFKPQWMFESDCLKVEKKEKNCAYLFDHFLGEGFNHVQSLKCRIFGPQCILSSLEHKLDIPRRSTPIFNLAMKDLVVCCSNLDKEIREELHKKVEMMGGEASKTLTDQVTHLVTGEVGSKKYQVSGDLGKQIMLPLWVEKVWEKSADGHIHGADVLFNEYSCPVFYGLVITVSGFDSTERGEMKTMIEAEGGKYTGEMKVKECTHLIINKPKGQKYEFARKWKMHIIKSEWLYDSVEKGYCLDESKYGLEGRDSGVKTSTPEKGKAKNRVSSIADISSISNISMIGNCQVNETAAMTRMNDTAATTRSDMTTFSETQVQKNDHIESSLQTIDLSRPPSDLFLDGCKIYLSGFCGQDLEKMKKVINAGGATRLNQLNEAVTHVILGVRIDRDIELLTSNTVRPQVVSPAWLAECYRNGRTVDEAPFSCLDIPQPESESPKLTVKQKKLERKESIQNKTLEPENIKPDEDDHKEEEEMDIMSQYLIQPKEDNTQDKTMKDEDKPTAIEQRPVETEADEMTQNPDGDSQIQKKVFTGKSFMFFGFEEEQHTPLTEFVNEEGGKVYQGNTRLVPDYGVVPVDGFPVDKTVGEIATSTWLQMCAESDTLLPVSSNPLFSPVDINIEDNPLVDCILSFSGWFGTEKECLMHIAQCIGAQTQEYFVRNAKKGLLPTTHLITKEASGQKYTAAKNWGIPALSKTWILACAKSGKPEPLEKYLIDNQQNVMEENESELSKTATTAVLNDRNESLKQDISMKGDNKAIKIDNYEQGVQANNSKRDSMTNSNQKDISKRGSGNLSVGMETMEAMEGFNSEMTIDGALPADKSKENIRDEENLDTTSTNNPKPFQESQKENVHQKKEPIPVQPKVVNQRVKALQNDDFETTPKNSSKRASISSPSPGRFLDPTKEFRPKWDLTDVWKCLETPPAEKARNAKRRQSQPLEELFTIKLQRAVEISEGATTATRGSDEVDGSGMDGLSQQEAGPLKGVVIAVSKKLSSHQAEYNNMVSLLGGDYRWAYDESCTHFIFQSTRANDTTKEFRVARDQKKIIVSSHWLLMCKEQNAWVDESLFPHNYNPNLTLSVSRKKTGTPARTPARSSRKATRATRLESASDLKPEILTFDQEVEKTLKKPVQKVMESDKETVSESDTDNEIRSRLGQGQTDTDTEIRSRLGNVVEVPEEITKGGRRNRKSSINSIDEDRGKEDAVPAAGSMEMREVLSKEMESIMAASKTKKAMRRRSKRLNCSGNLSGDLSGSADKNSSRQNRWSLTDDKVEKKTPTSSGKALENHSGPEPSQSVQVTWDDHTGRLEQEKLAHKLERACSPTQDVAEFLDGEFSEEEEDIDYEEGLHEPEAEVPQEKPKEERVPTPEGPSLAFHKSRKEENRIPSPEPEEEPVQKPPPVFIMSGMEPAEKDNYGALVEQLGGKILESLHFDCSCTHLVIGKPTRNEKFLASVASGKWVLHKSYFEACRQERQFVQEDFYEWGGDGTQSLLNQQTAKLAAAAYRWRIKVQNTLQSTNQCIGAFDGWTVLLNCDKVKDDNFKRLLEAGGATVLQNKPPYEENISASHAFLDLSKKPLQPSDIQVLLGNNILCLKPEFIAAHLTDNPPPNPLDYCPPDISGFVSVPSGSDRNKRKALSLSSTSDSENKSKRTRKR